ncbi:universal stress protein [Lactobacillus hilgardii]|uniref:Universal stress family protein n=2 Tax=Lentilactobacillus hilgardii TaxID=1588 RepID=C0XGV3_LENH9|nr:universal stress family protein [Lentilactobacillus hilgardii DSM 20176 = ATCC 8290]MCT3397731.1 universal stress protein [Lentilactobacillus hilgardii]MCT3398106.1 universal stress protein [Lentilactobacillus hilgardii]QEU39359.1 universal stress protein [Lentilactobacillus hilgardii]
MLLMLERRTNMYNNILVPIDGSENSSKALDVAIEYSKLFNSKITVLSVTNENYYGVGTLPPEAYTKIDDTAKRIVSNAEKFVSSKGIEVKGIAQKGNAKQVIVEFANSRADLVIIGKSGTNTLDRFIMGSTTEYVVRNAKVQVLVVNA